MPMKGSGPATDPDVERWDGGLSWIAYPDEGMQRASHALADGDGVWVVDPVDAEGIDAELADLGTIAGAVVLLGRHKRDAAALARRHDVPVYVPAWMDGVGRDLDVPVERFGGELPGTGYRLTRVIDRGFWQEGALSDGETLLVPEAVGTAPYFRAGDERLGVHPMLRLFPPRRALGGFSPDRVLVGHGRGVFEGAAAALSEALANSRRRAPRAYAEALGAMF